VNETPEDLGATKAAEHDGQKSDNSKGDADKQAPVEENLADQVRDQGRTINELTTKLDKFIEFMMSNAHAGLGTPRRVVDPQEEEILAGTAANASAKDGRQQHDPGLWAQPLVMPATSANAEPRPSTLKDYHDIVEDMVAKKFK
jgi:hypothetical protein